MSVDERLAQFLKDPRDWEKEATSIPGLFLLKLPGLSSNHHLSLEINPIDSSGLLLKREELLYEP